MAPRPTDALLWRVQLEGGGPPQKLSLTGLQPTCIAWSRDEGLVYVYAVLPQRETMDLNIVAERGYSLSIDDAPATNATPCRLESVLDLPGASHTAKPEAHYVVETAAESGWMPEIARWYADEHLPRLAAVPGCVWARRYINHDDVRSSFACYDLTAPEVKESSQWLAVRETEWSSRTRPHFMQTRRTMFFNITEASR